MFLYCLCQTGIPWDSLQEARTIIYLYLQNTSTPADKDKTLDVIRRFKAKSPKHGFHPHIFWLCIDLPHTVAIGTIVDTVKRELGITKPDFVQTLSHSEGVESVMKVAGI